MKLAFNSCLDAKLGLRIEDTREIAGILNFEDGELEGRHAYVVRGLSSSVRIFHSGLKSRPVFTSFLIEISFQISISIRNEKRNELIRNEL